jgi:Ala-tRNA(Pro) deacylase
MRSTSYLAEQRVAFDPIAHAPAFCASRRASWLRTPGREVAKAVLLAGPDGLFLAVLRATHEVALDELSGLWSGTVRLASAEESARVFRDCEWGAASAFGNLYGLPTILDAGLDAGDRIVFEVGSHFAGVRLTCRDFERLTGALRLDFTRPLPRRASP